MKKLRPRGIVILSIFGIGIIILIFLMISSIFNIDRNRNNNYPNLQKENLPEEIAVVTNIWIHNYSKLDVLKNNNVKYLFIDVGGTKIDGTFNNSISEMKIFYDFIEDYQKNSNHSFVLLPYSEVQSDRVDITSDEFKKNYVNSYYELVKIGYDGMLVDIEPVKVEERDSFLSIIYELQATLPNNAIVSVYTSHIVEEKTDNVWEWEREFYKRVSLAADIISAPGYDTDIKNENEYREHILKQVDILSNINNSKFLFAIPSHKKYPELSEIALDAFYESVSENPKNNFIGITLFSEWTADKQDWNNIQNYKRKLEVLKE